MRSTARLDPGFYSVDINVLVNLESWKRLTDAQRKILNDAALWLEELDKEHVAMADEEREKQSKAGIQAIKATETQAKEFTARAVDIGWATVASRSPNLAPKLVVVLRLTAVRHPPIPQRICSMQARQRMGLKVSLGRASVRISFVPSGNVKA